MAVDGRLRHSRISRSRLADSSSIDGVATRRTCRARTPRADMLLLVCTLVFAQQLAFDLDDMDCVIAIVARRVSHVSTSWRRHWLRGYLWVIPPMHLALHFMVVAATVALLLSASDQDSLNSASILLDFLAMGFLLQLDDTLAAALVPAVTMELASEIASGQRGVITWLSNRVQAFLAGATLVSMILAIERIMILAKYLVFTMWWITPARLRYEFRIGSDNIEIVACEDLPPTVLTAAWVGALITMTISTLVEHQNLGPWYGWLWCKGHRKSKVMARILWMLFRLIWISWTIYILGFAMMESLRFGIGHKRLGTLHAPETERNASMARTLIY